MLDRLNTASFKGVRFSCNDTTTNVGRALIRHEFANSDVDSIEDQGLIPRSYTLVAIIHGDNYAVDRDALLSAIESRGPGVLIHPFYGRIENAVALPVTYDETVKSLGRIEIPITFEVSDSTGQPVANFLTTSGITQRKTNLLDAVITSFGSEFSISNRYPRNVTDAINKALLFSDTVARVTAATSTSTEVTAFTSRLDSFVRNTAALVNSPAQLATEVVGIVSDISGLYNTPEQVLNVSSGLFNFGDDDQSFPLNTASRIERANNRIAFNDAVKASSLAVSYEAASLRSYRTVNDVDNVSRQLEQVYRAIKR